jgi:hypothetical protein
VIDLFERIYVSPLGTPRKCPWLSPPGGSRVYAAYLEELVLREPVCPVTNPLVYARSVTLGALRFAEIGRTFYRTEQPSLEGLGLIAEDRPG